MEKPIDVRKLKEDLRKATGDVVGLKQRVDALAEEKKALPGVIRELERQLADKRSRSSKAEAEHRTAERDLKEFQDHIRDINDQIKRAA